MKKIIPVFYLLLILLGLVAEILSTIQFIMALRFGELGRVVVYFTLVILSLALFLVGLTKMVRMRNPKEKKVQS